MSKQITTPVVKPAQRTLFQQIKRVAIGLVMVIALLFIGLIAANWQSDLPVTKLQARWALPPSTFMEVAGMPIHLRDEGRRDDPSPIVLLHGTSASLHTWEGWVRELQGQRRVISFDLPGFGLTGPTPDDNYTMDNYVRVTLAVLDRLNVQKCVMGGNSFGGRIAWQTALAAPARVERLILVDAAGYPQNSTSVPIAFRIAQLPVANKLLEVTLSRRIVENSVRNVYGDPTRVTPELIDRYFELTLRAGNRHALVQRFQQAPSNGNDYARIKELKQPTLIIWGGKDQLIPPSNGQRFHQDIAGSQLVVFDDLGHVPHEEDPARTVAAAKQFLGLN